MSSVGTAYQLISIDKVVGTWETKKVSGAIPPKNKANILNRLDELEKALKKARQRANSQVVEHKKVGKELFNYVFGNDLDGK